MDRSPHRQPRRLEALSKERIISATIDLLDASGEQGLTVRALTARLETGRGAIYHHVAGKDELLAEATDQVIRSVFDAAKPARTPVEAIRSIATDIFQALTQHPWVGTQLSREPRQLAVRRLWKGLGEQLRLLGVTGLAGADAGAALMNYLLGAAAQYAAGVQQLPAGASRLGYLKALADELDQTGNGTTPETVESLLTHDDHDQFLAGINLFLAGIQATRDSE